MTAAALPGSGAWRCGVVDFHAHVVHPAVYAQTVNHNVVSGFGRRRLEETPQPGSPRWPIFAKMTDPLIQIADMEARGVAHAVILTSTVSQSTFFAEAGLAAVLDRQANEGIASWVARYPDRFTGTATLPVQDIGRAVDELDHAVRRLGLRIVQLPASYGEHYLGAAYFRPLWEAISALGVTAYVHPDGIKDPAFQEYSLWNAIGQGIEETRCMASIIYEGLLDRMPALRIVMAHAGGFLPTYIARLDRNATAHPVSIQNIGRKPSEYLQNFFFDTVTYDPMVIEIMMRRVGVERLVFGSDYPFGDAEPLDMLDRCLLTPSERAAVIGGNGAALIATAQPGCA